MKRLTILARAIVVLGTFVFIYADLWPLVGRFPAESLTIADPASNAALALCYRSGERAAAFSNVASPPAPGSLGGPRLTLAARVTRGEIDAFANSRALAYARDTRTVFAINPLDSDAVVRLDELAFWGAASRGAVDAFETRTKTIFPDCPDPQSDRGLTEAYWATKGTSVLHHWAFLYDASVFDGKPIHAQYGSLVSAIAHGIANVLGLAGPTGFVRVAWWVFCAVGIAAALGLAFVLRRTPGIALLAIAAQTLAFVTLGSFSILLAPGYHWARELVIVAPMLLVAYVERTRPTKRRSILACFVAFALCDTIDPSFALFAFAAFAVAFALVRRERVSAYIAARPQSAGFVALGALVVVAAFLVIDRSNLSYVVAQVAYEGGLAVLNPAHNEIFAFNGALAAIALCLSWYRRTNVALPYFALVSMIVFLYYVITPDDFHYGKYVAYAIPLYATFGAALYRRLARLNVRPLHELLDLAIGFAVPIVCGCAIAQLIAVGPQWQLRTYDAGGRAFFSSTPARVNGRLIDADLNADGTARLGAFPSALPYDYIVSPLDKYVLFLYDRHNGFDNVDNVSTMSDDARLATLERVTTAPGRHTILDAASFVVDPRSGLLSNHPVFGSINEQSVYDEKKRVRFNELAARLINTCAHRNVDKARRWYYVSC